MEVSQAENVDIVGRNRRPPPMCRRGASPLTRNGAPRTRSGWVGLRVGRAIIILTALLLWYRVRTRAAARETTAAAQTPSGYSGGFTYKSELAGDTSKLELRDTDMLRARAPTEPPRESRPVELYLGGGSWGR
jgi:hypothetical protein